MKGLMDSDHYNNNRGGKDDSDSEKYESLFLLKKLKGVEKVSLV